MARWVASGSSQGEPSWQGGWPAEPLRWTSAGLIGRMLERRADPQPADGSCAPHFPGSRYSVSKVSRSTTNALPVCGPSGQ